MHRLFCDERFLFLIFSFAFDFFFVIVVVVDVIVGFDAHSRSKFPKGFFPFSKCVWSFYLVSSAGWQKGIVGEENGNSFITCEWQILRSNRKSLQRSHQSKDPTG